MSDRKYAETASRLVTQCGEEVALHVVEKMIRINAESAEPFAGVMALFWCRIKVAILQVTVPAEGIH